MGTKRAGSALIVDGDNNLLVLRRGETHPYAAFEADLPGGFIDDTETHRDGVAREISEEIGLKISADDLSEVSSILHKDFYRMHQIEHSFFAYRFKERPAITLSWEHDEYQWLPISEVRGLEGPVQREIKRIISSGFFDTF